MIIRSTEECDILYAAVVKHGHYNQIDMLHEEMGELMQAINKVKRHPVNKGREGILHPNEVNDIDYSQKFFAACSEMADVKVMLTQMELIFDAEACQISLDRKIERLKERLNKNV